MRIALEEAEYAIARGDDPFGAVIADRQGNIVVRDGNRENTERNRAAHAEIVAIRGACHKLGANDLGGLISVCNGESCPMCMSALILAGVREFYYGMHMRANCDPYLRMTEVAVRARGSCLIEGGILESECTETVFRGWRLRGREII